MIGFFGNTHSTVWVV